MKDQELYEKEKANSQKLNIDILPLLAKLYHKKLFVCTISIAFGILGIIVALTSDRKYTASEVVVPEQEQDMKSSLMNSLSSFMDISTAVGSEEGAYNVTIFPEMASSKPFLASLLKVKVIPSPKKKGNMSGNDTKQKPVTLYDYYTDPSKMSLSERLIESVAKMIHLTKMDSLENSKVINFTHFTKKQEGLIKLLDNSTDIVINKKTGITTISFTIDDPYIAQQMADTISVRLQQMVTDYKTIKAKEKLAYYTKMSKEARIHLLQLQKRYAAAADGNFFVQLQSVQGNIDRLEQDAILAENAYSTIEKQRISAEMELQDKKPVFVVLEPAVYPNKANSGRVIVVIMYGMLGFILSSIWAICGSNIVKHTRESWRIIKSTKS